MATFVYYNASTNKIERLRPFGQTQIQHPYLLNILPPSFESALQRADLHQGSLKPKLQQPTQLVKVESPVTNVQSTKREFVQVFDLDEDGNIYNDEENWDHNKGSRILEPQVVPLEPNNFLLVDDINENEFPDVKRQANRARDHERLLRNEQQKKEQSRGSKRKQYEGVYQPNSEELTRSFAEEPVERIYDKVLEGKYIQEEKKRSQQAVLNSIDNEIKRIESQAKNLDQRMQKDNEDVTEFENKTLTLEEEIRRRVFAREADRISRKIDEALQKDDETSMTDRRLDAFYKENEDLYREIDAVLAGEQEQNETFYQSRISPSKNYTEEDHLDLIPARQTRRTTSKARKTATSQAKTTNNFKKPLIKKDPRKIEHLLKAANKLASANVD